MPNTSNRAIETDILFDCDLTKEDFSNRLMIRGIAKEKTFKDIDFRYTIFDTCYLRLCTFENCNFTGCRFTGCNLIGSTFLNCNFNYAVFERTQVTPEILDTNCPGWENLKLKFARTLRTNFQSLGDSEAANKAIALELNATEAHLFKAWKTSESYYRARYQGWNRITVFFQWLSFKTLDMIWGNGESTSKLLLATLALLAVMALIHVLYLGDPNKISEYWSAFQYMPQVLLGVTNPPNYPGLYLAVIALVRLIAFGLFMAIIIKRLNKR